MEEKRLCKDCGTKLDAESAKGVLLCNTCGPLRVVKEQWKPYASSSSIQSVYHIPDYGDQPRKEPRKWPN
jgi:DNA-directed RNA polymerase subunit RPC12/RpoP